jgi:hypothetical protein
MAAPKRSKIYTRYHTVDKITVQDIRDMFKVFCRYYENTSLDQFIVDLGKKTGAFIVRRESDDAIVGFSTLGIYHLTVDGRKVRGFFSGDTIVEKEYWGHGAINNAFLKRLLIEAIKDPFTAQYWFLISKGYKTFLLLSRNFPEYYPSPKHMASRDQGHMKNIITAYCEELFPGVINRDSMVLDFGEGANCLKNNVTPITSDMRQDPDIAFFAQCNPEWERGCELPCLGRADLLNFFLPAVFKQAIKRPLAMAFGQRGDAQAHGRPSRLGKALARLRGVQAG